jgi:hypothetical protein
MMEMSAAKAKNTDLRTLLFKKRQNRATSTDLD